MKSTREVQSQSLIARPSARPIHSFACSTLLVSLARSVALIHSLARLLTRFLANEKVIHVHELNASISYYFHPLCERPTEWRNTLRVVVIMIHFISILSALMFLSPLFLFLQDCKWRENRLLGDYSELEEENVTLQKQFSELREQIIEFETLKVTNKRLKDDLDEMDHQLNEVNRAKQSAEIKVSSTIFFESKEGEDVQDQMNVPNATALWNFL